jgi:hypothetical protein
MSDYYDEGGGREERDVRYSEEAGPWASRSSVDSAGEAADALAAAAARSTAKAILWWIVLVLFMAVTVALIKTVTIVGVVVGAVGVSLLAWDEERSWRRRGRKQS